MVQMKSEMMRIWIEDERCESWKMKSHPKRMVDNLMNILCEPAQGLDL